MSKIIVKTNAINELKKYIESKKFSNIVVLIDKKLKNIKKLIENNFTNTLIIELTSKESTKSLKSVYSIYSKLLKNKIDRHSLLISVGGGVIGDTAGFVASTYLRGIAWVQVPTTLLAQVDSSVGGKTAINHEAGKNLIGTFYQPDAIFSDVSFLKTLPNRELNSGLAETLKYGFALDSYFFKECVANLKKAKKKDPATLEKIVTKSVQIKSKIVSLDEKDKLGIRQFLNFGHTFGHALEKFYNYKRFNHGEAVAVGMKFAIVMSYLKGMFSAHDLTRAMNGLSLLETPKLSKLNEKVIWSHMLKDKKNMNNTVNMVLLGSIGKAVANQPVSYKEFKKSLKVLREMS